MTERAHDIDPADLRIQPTANPVMAYLDFTARGFEFSADSERRLLVRPFDQLTEHDLHVLHVAQRANDLWAVVTTFELMNTWRREPLTLHRLATATPRDICHFDLRGTTVDRLRDLRRVCHGMSRSSAVTHAELAAHLWQERTQILDAEIARRCNTEEWAEVSS